MGFDLLFHLDLLGVAFLLVEFGSQASEFLSIIGLFMGFSSDTLSRALFMVEPEAYIRGQLSNNVLDGLPQTFYHVASATVRYTRFEAVCHVSVRDIHFFLMLIGTYHTV